MTREEIEETYKIKNGRIVSPGEYENEPIYTPYYVDLMKEGYWEGRNKLRNVYSMTVEPEDREMFPEIPKIKRCFLLFQRNDGMWYIK